MRKIVCIATQDKRANTLALTVESLLLQADQIHVHNNDQLKDYTDNAKFLPLNDIKEPCYVFLCDDDLIYPPQYIEKTIEMIEKYGCIISWHGRILQGTGKNYYQDHKTFGCLETVLFEDGEAIKLDVCGTGVTGFRTDYFHPKDLHLAKETRMADLVFSLEAAKQNKTIGLIEHEIGWIKNALPEDSGVFGYWQNKLLIDQNRLADEIYKLNYES
jgi:hypothetical protein